MLHSRSLEAAVIGSLAALATFCALSARAGDTYSIVAQSSHATAATGRRPLAERIAAANLPIIVQTAATTPEAPAAEEDAENRPIPPVALASAAAGDESAHAASAAADPPRAASAKAARAQPTTGLRLPWMNRQPARSAARPNPTRR
jgi:hypothetical protein